MRHIATTEPFLPKNKDAIAQQLLSWNLSEDLGIRDEGDGYISVYAKEGATSWPVEWTPEGDDLFEDFEIGAFLREVAQEGQSISTHDSGGTLGVYISRVVEAALEE